MFVGILAGLITCLSPIALGLLLFLLVTGSQRRCHSQSRESLQCPQK